MYDKKELPKHIYIDVLQLLNDFANNFFIGCLEKFINILCPGGRPGGISAAGSAEGKCKNLVKQSAPDDLND